MALRIRQQLRFLRKLGPPSYNSNNHHHRFVFYCKKNEMASPVECINPVAVWILRFATLPLCNNRFSSWIPVRRFLHSVQEISSISSSSSSTKLVLYSYWQSSCSWRVRFALNLKGFPYEYRAIDLLKGEQFSPEFERLNPLHFVPALVDGDVVVSDSFAILLYLEEKYPQNSLLPVDPKQKSVNLQNVYSEYQCLVLHNTKRSPNPLPWTSAFYTEVCGGKPERLPKPGKMARFRNTPRKQVRLPIVRGELAHLADGIPPPESVPDNNTDLEEEEPEGEELKEETLEEDEDPKEEELEEDEYIVQEPVLEMLDFAYEEDLWDHILNGPVWDDEDDDAEVLDLCGSYLLPPPSSSSDLNGDGYE